MAEFGLHSGMSCMALLSMISACSAAEWKRPLSSSCSATSYSLPGLSAPASHLTSEQSLTAAALVASSKTSSCCTFDANHFSSKFEKFGTCSLSCRLWNRLVACFGACCFGPIAIMHSRFLLHKVRGVIVAGDINPVRGSAGWIWRSPFDIEVGPGVFVGS